MRVGVRGATAYQRVRWAEREGRWTGRARMAAFTGESEQSAEYGVEGAFDSPSRFISVVEHVEPVAAVWHIDDMQLHLAAVCGLDERVDRVRDRSAVPAGSGQHDGQRAGPVDRLGGPEPWIHGPAGQG